MKWLKELIWKIKNPLTFDTRSEVIEEFERGKENATPCDDKYNIVDKVDGEDDTDALL